jgi:hypothetical protein
MTGEFLIEGRRREKRSGMRGVLSVLSDGFPLTTCGNDGDGMEALHFSSGIHTAFTIEYALTLKGEGA